MALPGKVAIGVNAIPFHQVACGVVPAVDRSTTQLVASVSLFCQVRSISDGPGEVAAKSIGAAGMAAA